MKYCFVVLFCFSGVILPWVARADSLTDLVVPISEKRWERGNTAGQFSRDIHFLLRLNNKYALNTWYRDLKGFPEQDGKYLDFGGNTEHFIRPVAHNVFSLAVALKLGVYSPKVTGISVREAEEIVLRLLGSVAWRHTANMGKGGWGYQWQSALWAAQVAEAAWILWDRLPEESRELVCRMMVSEAERFVDYKVPYFRDLEGKVLIKGDTKAEENAWNSNILAVSMAMMPGHPHYQLWRNKCIELQLSAYAAPDDLRRRDTIDGYVLCEVLKGSNLNMDGTAVNHDRIHPDYMVAIMHNATNVWLFRLAGQQETESSLFNGVRVYDALTELDFNGKTIFCRNAKGKASSLVYFPEGNDWGEGRQENYWLMDVLAHLFHWDVHSTVKGLDWAKARNKKMIEMISRNNTGQFYQSETENSFKTREEWFGAHLAWGCLGWWLQ